MGADTQFNIYADIRGSRVRIGEAHAVTEDQAIERFLRAEDEPYYNLLHEFGAVYARWYCHDEPEDAL